MLVEWLQGRLGTGHPTVHEVNDRVTKTPLDGSQLPTPFMHRGLCCRQLWQYWTGKWRPCGQRSLSKRRWLLRLSNSIRAVCSLQGTLLLVVWLLVWLPQLRCAC